MDNRNLKKYVDSQRKNTEKKEVLTVALPVEIKQKLWDVADRFSCDLSVIVRAALVDFLEAQEKREPPPLFEDK